MSMSDTEFPFADVIFDLKACHKDGGSLLAFVFMKPHKLFSWGYWITYIRVSDSSLKWYHL